MQPKPQPDKSAKSWLQTCRLSLSPAEDLIVFSKEDKGVFLLSALLRFYFSNCFSICSLFCCTVVDTTFFLTTQHSCYNSVSKK